MAVVGQGTEANVHVFVAEHSRAGNAVVLDAIEIDVTGRQTEIGSVASCERSRPVQSEFGARIPVGFEEFHFHGNQILLLVGGREVAFDPLVLLAGGDDVESVRIRTPDHAGDRLGVLIAGGRRIVVAGPPGDGSDQVLLATDVGRGQLSEAVDGYGRGKDATATGQVEDFLDVLDEFARFTFKGIRSSLQAEAATVFAAARCVVASGGAGRVLVTSSWEL